LLSNVSFNTFYF